MRGVDVPRRKLPRVETQISPLRQLIHSTAHSAPSSTLDFQKYLQNTDPEGRVNHHALHGGKVLSHSSAKSVVAVCDTVLKTSLMMKCIM